MNRVARVLIVLAAVMGADGVILAAAAAHQVDALADALALVLVVHYLLKKRVVEFQVAAVVDAVVRKCLHGCSEILEFSRQHSGELNEFFDVRLVLQEFVPESNLHLHGVFYFVLKRVVFRFELEHRQDVEIEYFCAPLLVLLQFSLDVLNESFRMELLEQLKNQPLAPAVVFMTAYADVQMTIQAMKRGAVNVIEKLPTPDILFQCVDEALLRSRQNWADYALWQTLQFDLEQLSDRELEVMELIANGESSSRGIALALGISNRTADKHRSHVLAKLGAKSAPDVVRKVMQYRELCSRFERRLDSPIP